MEPMRGNDIFRCLNGQWDLALYQSKKELGRVGWKKGNFLRNLSVISQKKDLQKWEDSGK